MSLDGTRQVMETTSAETVNQYLRFGWKLINQYVTPARADSPAVVTYVLASVRSLEDTKEVVSIVDAGAANLYLKAGWTLIDKCLLSSTRGRRKEVLHYVLAWQGIDVPIHPTKTTSAAARGRRRSPRRN